MQAGHHQPLPETGSRELSLLGVISMEQLTELGGFLPPIAQPGQADGIKDSVNSHKTLPKGWQHKVEWAISTAPHQSLHQSALLA